MNCRIEELRGRQVVCVENGRVLGHVSDIELDPENGALTALVIYGRPKLFGVLGHESDLIIPWHEIAVIGKETILVSSDPAPASRDSRRSGY